MTSPAIYDSAGGRPANPRAAVLWPVDVRGDPQEDPVFPRGPHLARPSPSERGHERGRVHGVP